MCDLAQALIFISGPAAGAQFGTDEVPNDEGKRRRQRECEEQVVEPVVPGVAGAKGGMDEKDGAGRHCQDDRAEAEEDGPCAQTLP